MMRNSMALRGEKMGAGIESKDPDGVKKLVQEAYMLSTQIASMNKQLQDKIDKYNGPLVTWFNKQNDLTQKGIEQGYDKAKEKGLEIAFKELLTLCRNYATAANALCGSQFRVDTERLGLRRQSNQNGAFC